MKGVRGIVLPAVLFLLVAILVPAFTVILLLGIDRLRHRAETGLLEARLHAEAGLHHLWSHLEPAPDFSQAATWPGGIPPFGARVDFPAPPDGYAVRVLSIAAGELHAESVGHSGAGGEVRIEATFRRAPAFRPPAALLVGPPGAGSRLEGGLELQGGFDGPIRYLPAGAESPTAASDLAARLGARDVGIVEPWHWSALLAAVPDHELGGPVGPASLGTPARPVIVRIGADGRVEGPLVVHGIVTGSVPLDVTGTLGVRGLVVAPEGLRIRGSVEVDGTIVVAGGFEILAGGSLRARYDEAGLDAAHEAAPGLLPREAYLGAWRSVW